MTTQDRKRGGRFLVLLAAFGLLVLPESLLSGPPFFTDDSMPIPRGSWEFYLASQSARAGGAWSGTAPHFEANYGGGTDLMLHVLVPMGFARASGGPFQYGLGDVELGFIYRLVKEKSGRPELGFFPHVELPSGSEARGLGSGRTRFFLPVWLSKHWGPWTTYGGGGLWVNPGPGNRNYWSSGWVVTRRISKTLEAGAEVFHNSASVAGGRAETAFNAGVLWSVGRGQQIILSAGRDIRGSGSFAMFVGYYLQLGPGD
jgi:hypothetical protein